MLYPRLLLVSIAFGLLFTLFPLRNTAQAQDANTSATLTPVSSEYVCMVTDKRFETPQLPVTVNDKTYYGCCPGCVHRLNQDRKIRYAVDPVSRDTVDKADAIVGVGPDGHAYYFESRANLRRFNSEDGNAGDDS